MISEIIDELDQADDKIREDLSGYHSRPFPEKEALQKARDLIQQAITILLKYR